MNAWAHIADLLDPTPAYLWACGVENCPGTPHTGAEQQHARWEQQPPDGDWITWVIRAGRGYGKTRTGAETLADRIIQHPTTTDNSPTEWLVAGETIQDSREICALGPSGLVAALHRRGVSHRYNRTLGVITTSNGCRVHLRGGDDPDLGRGLNLAGAWLDEIGTWRRAETAWTEGVIPALRQPLISDHPRAVLTTTPKPGPGSRLLADLSTRTDGSVYLTRGSTFDNAGNLSAQALAELRSRYPEGSRLYRQELLGEIVDDIEGALWHQDTIDRYRVEQAPETLNRVVVAVDPAASYHSGSDATGIVVAGSSGFQDDIDFYVIEDLSLHAPPEKWGEVAVEAWERYQADGVVIEVNQGGAMATQVVVQAARHLRARGVIATLPRVLQVRATRGKALRAEPVATLYEQGRVHHVGALPELERELVSWTPDTPKSPDRLDATVWALSHLMRRTAGAAGSN